MPLRIWRRFQLVPGVRMNLSRRGASLSLGHRGFWYTLGSHGHRVTAGIPGTGIFCPQDRLIPAAPPVSAKKRIILSGLGFLERAYNLLGTTATLMGPPEGNALLTALRYAIEALSKLLKNGPP
jgi:hypothetical protein